MSARPLRSLLLPLLLALGGCSSSPSSSAPDGGPADGGPHDGGPTDGGPVRTLTTRALLGTSTRNLLLDPFVTTDPSLGHFVAALLPPVNSSLQTTPIARSYVSQAPAGVALPVAVFPALSTSAPGSTSLQIVAPIPGGSDPFDARIWVSAGDAKGAPVSFDTVAKSVTVALLPNDLPGTTEPAAFPLSPSGTPPVTLAGRQWVELALPSPAPVPKGGWFSILVQATDVSLQLQAPEVVPTAAPGPHPLPPTAPRTEADRAGPRAYAELIRRPR